MLALDEKAWILEYGLWNTLFQGVVIRNTAQLSCCCREKCQIWLNGGQESLH